MTRNNATEPKANVTPLADPPKRAATQTASDELREVRPLVRVVHDGETYEPGATFKVGGKQLQALLDIKAVEIV